MNETLGKAERWLNELGIKNIPRPTCLMVNRDDVDNLWGIGVIYKDVVNEINTALNTKKIILANKDREWLYLESF